MQDLKKGEKPPEFPDTSKISYTVPTIQESPLKNLFEKPTELSMENKSTTSKTNNKSPIEKNTSLSSLTALQQQTEKSKVEDTARTQPPKKNQQQQQVKHKEEQKQQQPENDWEEKKQNLENKHKDNQSHFNENQRNDANESNELNGKFFSGDMTFFDIGLNACGFTDKEPDFIVAISQSFFDSFGAENSNKSPVCNRKIKIEKGGKTAIARVTDACPGEDTMPTVYFADFTSGCAYYDLDMSRALFSTFSSLDVGRTDMKWQFMS